MVTKILEKQRVGAPSLAYSAVVATATKAGWRELFGQHALDLRLYSVPIKLSAVYVFLKKFRQDYGIFRGLLSIWLYND